MITLSQTRISVSTAHIIQLSNQSAISADTALDQLLRTKDIEAFEPQRITVNVPGPGMIYIERLTVDGFDLLHGQVIDAWQWNANAVGQHLGGRILTPAAKISMRGQYTGWVPPNYKSGDAFEVTLAMVGPARGKVVTP